MQPYFRKTSDGTLVPADGARQCAFANCLMQAEAHGFCRWHDAAAYSFHVVPPGMRSVERVRYPDEEPRWPGCDPIKRHAARYARAKTQAVRSKALEKLADALDALDDGALLLWANVRMIDHRFCGATGTGAYWAVASEAVNRLAKRTLEGRAA